MKYLIMTILMTSFTFAGCLEMYQADNLKKKNSYDKKLKRMHHLRSEAIYSGNALFASVGSSIQAPEKPDMFEDEILSSAGYGYKYISKSVAEVYKELKGTHPFITHKMIQDQYKQGLTSGEFCKKVFWIKAKKNVDGAKKYVLKELSKKRDIAHSTSVEVSDSELSKGQALEGEGNSEAKTLIQKK